MVPQPQTAIEFDPRCALRVTSCVNRPVGGRGIKLWKQGLSLVSAGQAGVFCLFFLFEGPMELRKQEIVNSILGVRLLEERNL